MRTVAIAQPYVPAYSLPFFDGLSKRLAEDDVALTVYQSLGLRQASTRKDAELPRWSVDVPAREFHIGGRAIVVRRLPKQARNADLLILEQALGKTDALRLLMPIRRRPIAMMGHGHIYNRDTSDVERGLLRTFTRRSDWFFGYTEAARDDARQAGLSDSHVTVFENSTDTATLSRYRQAVTADQIAAVREQLGLADARVLVLLGSIDESKRPEFLLSALESIWREVPNTVLVLVGEGDAADRIANADSRVIRAGRLTGTPLAELAATADAIVMPGRVGLVATDSFALELPLVTTAWEFHSPEFAYLVDGYNALITPDSPADFASAVTRLLLQPEEQQRLRQGCRESVAHYSTENMVSRFADGISKAISVAPRHASILASARTAPRRVAKRVVGLIPPLRRQLFTSTDYVVTADVEDPNAGWSAERAVRRQDRAWHDVVDEALAGRPREDVVALWSAIELAQPRAVLEVGSGHGYLFDLMQHVRPGLVYAGLDISLSMCRTARAHRADLSLVVGDAARLPFADRSVDVVLDAATLMHVPLWRRVIQEEARVANRELVLHSVTVAETDSVIPMRKYAYGVPVFEAVMSRSALVDELERSGFTVVHVLASLDYDLRDEIGVATRSETWVCDRRPA